MFAAAKARGQRTVNIREWVAALGSMAAELGVPVERMVADMVARKPHAAATIAATATQQKFNLSTTRRRGVSAVMADDEPVAIEELLLSLADVGLFEGATCQVSVEYCVRSNFEPGARTTVGLVRRNESTDCSLNQACADSLNETLDVIMGGSGRDPVMEDFAYFHRELTRIQKANERAPPRRLPVPAAVWQSKEQVPESRLRPPKPQRLARLRICIRYRPPYLCPAFVYASPPHV